MTKKQDFFYQENLDLTDDQIYITQQTYLQHAEDYVFNFERKDGALEHARPFTVDPFLKHLSLDQQKGTVLFAGCGSGRDIQVFNNLGIDTVGIDISEKLLEIGKKIGVKTPLKKMDLQEINLPESNFTGIFCETAISHIKKAHLRQVLDNFYKLLKPEGLCLLGFRQGNGHVYYTDDAVGGRRYNTTFSSDEVSLIISQSRFKILEKNVADHQVKERPSFINLITQKI